MVVTASIVNAHHKHPLVAFWDDGTTSSSDAQDFLPSGRVGSSSCPACRLQAPKRQNVSLEQPARFQAIGMVVVAL